MVTFKKGDDFLKEGADHKTFGIHCINWAQQIEVHGDEELRDRILRLLQEDNLSEAGQAPGDRIRAKYEMNRKLGEPTGLRGDPS